MQEYSIRGQGRLYGALYRLEKDQTRESFNGREIKILNSDIDENKCKAISINPNIDKRVGLSSRHWKS